ncbi:MAG: type II secretion system F family protein [Candidatus Omnitrophica bacterium]|nr:type II secretion system F family protein [Candidatus Omnitrophota bacterium]
MPKYSYIVKNKAGVEEKNVVDAVSQQSLIEKLQREGYFIVRVLEIKTTSHLKKKTSKKNEKRKFSRKKTKLEDLLSFSRQLATMLEAGVSLIRSLDVILIQVQSEELYNILKACKKDVEQGIALSVSLSKYPNVFNQFWVSLIEVGEASGTVPVVLNKLSFYLEQQAEFRATIISGLIYPAILFMVAVGAIAFFALFVGPRFQSIFDSMNVDLPMITVVLLASFSFLKKNIFLIIAGIVAGVFFLKKYIKTYQGKLLFEKAMFNMPVFGEVYRLIIVERFTSQMSILIDAGVPILYALDISERLVDNNSCAMIISTIKEGVREGELLVAPMTRSGFFPAMCLQMIMVGEETGELSKMLKHVSAYYQDLVSTFMKRFATIVEPFMLVFMGGVIGTIVLAMFLPMFNIAQLGGG